MSEEIGRELKASELKPGVIVVLMKDGSAMAITIWVSRVTENRAEFEARSLGMTLALARTGEDCERLADNAGVRIRAYEYLGEP